jgi:hypothetical protein
MEMYENEPPPVKEFTRHFLFHRFFVFFSASSAQKYVKNKSIKRS